MNLVEFVNMNRDVEPDHDKTLTHDILGSLSITVPTMDLPVPVESSDWITLSDPERLYKKFTFTKQSHVIYFVNELISYQNQVQHHCKVTIENLDIQVETHTHDINSVTDLDIKLSRFCDEIYDDTRFLDNVRE